VDIALAAHGGYTYSHGLETAVETGAVRRWGDWSTTQAQWWRVAVAGSMLC
jgi:urease accessory protein UreF